MTKVMTAKDKSKELVDRYWEELEIGFDNSKRCALIAVDEILKTDPMIENGISDAGFDYKPNDDYWYDVKSEIEKL